MILNRVNNNISQEQAINGVIKVLKNLASIIEKENQLLRVGNISRIEDSINEKALALQSLSNAQTVIEEFFRKNGKLKRDTSSMNTLKKLFSDLSVINHENDILIRSNLEVSNKLVEMYKESKTDQILSQFGYNKEGKSTVAEKVENIMPSISLNNKV